MSPTLKLTLRVPGTEERAGPTPPQTSIGHTYRYFLSAATLGSLSVSILLALPDTSTSISLHCPYIRIARFIFFFRALYVQLGG